MSRWFQTVQQNPYTPTLLILIAAIVAATLIFLANILSTKQQRFSRNAARNRSLPKATEFPFTVKIGSNISYVFQPGKVPREPWFPQNFEMELGTDLAILISAEFRQRDGSVIGQIQQSTLSMNLIDKYDVNSDLNGFEVIDNRDEPILQVECKEHGTLVVVNCVTYEVDPADGRTYLFVAAEDGTDLRRPVNLAPSHVLKRMFRYPGSDLPGVRSEENTRARQAEIAAETARQNTYAVTVAELRRLDTSKLADRLRTLATEIDQLESSRQFSFDPTQRDRERIRVLAIYQNTLEARTLAARDTAQARLGSPLAGSLPQYSYKSVNLTALVVVPIDLRSLAEALEKLN